MKSFAVYRITKSGVKKYILSVLADAYTYQYNDDDMVELGFRLEKPGKTTHTNLTYEGRVIVEETPSFQIKEKE